MNESGIAWLAGLIEGEGTIIWRPSGKAVTLNVFMTDEDVLQRCRTLTGLGSVRGPYHDKRPNHRPIWKWSVNKADDVATILAAIRPWMGQRRGERIDATLVRLETIRGRAGRLCGRGHNNWRPNGYRGRYCLDCRNDAQRRRRALGAA